MDQSVLDEVDGAGGGGEAVCGGFELRSGIGELIEPAVLWVCKPNVAGDGMDEKIVYGVEVVAEVVVQDGGAFVSCWI